eukprot:6220135-Pyramimonas_sp.AAC.1
MGRKRCFKHAMQIPGMKHLMHNLTLSLTDRLQLWKPFLEKGVKPLSKLLFNGWWRDRFIATCVDPSEFDSKALFAG